MRVLLIYPLYPETFWSFKHVLKFIARKAAFPPLGLLTVAAMLPQSWQKRLVDMNVSPVSDADIQWAEMVFVSAMLIQQESAREVIGRCQRLGRTVVAGGPAFTAQREKFPGVDHFVLNEAEVTLPLFLEDVARGRPRAVYTSRQRPDITKTPVPLWSLIDLDSYATMAVQYSRGCPYNCEFCDIVIMNGRRPRAKTLEQMVCEFQALYDAGWRRAIFIVDDNFIGNRKEVKKLLAGIGLWQREKQFPFTLLTEASIDLARDGELMRLMSRANFNKVFLGLETPNPESLKECGKAQNTGLDLGEAVDTIHRHGMQVMGGFIVGFDSDTETIFDAQIRFIQRIGVVTAMVGMLTALPRTRLWHRLNDEGRLLDDASGDNTGWLLNFEPVMGREQLLAGYRKILTTIYSRRSYYGRINTFIKNYTPTVTARLTSDDLAAFWKSVWRIGVFSRSSVLYWRLLINTVVKKRKALPIAVELAIHGLHFEKLVRRISRNLLSAGYE